LDETKKRFVRKVSFATRLISAAISSYFYQQ